MPGIHCSAAFLPLKATVCKNTKEQGPCALNNAWNCKILFQRISDPRRNAKITSNAAYSEPKNPKPKSVSNPNLFFGVRSLGLPNTKKKRFGFDTDFGLKPNGFQDPFWIFRTRHALRRIFTHLFSTPRHRWKAVAATASAAPAHPCTARIQDQIIGRTNHHSTSYHNWSKFSRCTPSSYTLL